MIIKPSDLARAAEIAAVPAAVAAVSSVLTNQNATCKAQNDTNGLECTASENIAALLIEDKKIANEIKEFLEKCISEGKNVSRVTISKELKRPDYNIRRAFDAFPELNQLYADAQRNAAAARRVAHRKKIDMYAEGLKMQLQAAITQNGILSIQELTYDTGLKKSMIKKILAEYPEAAELFDAAILRHKEYEQSKIAKKQEEILQILNLIISSGKRITMTKLAEMVQLSYHELTSSYMTPELSELFYLTNRLPKIRNEQIGKKIEELIDTEENNSENMSYEFLSQSLGIEIKKIREVLRKNPQLQKKFDTTVNIQMQKEVEQIKKALLYIVENAILDEEYIDIKYLSEKLNKSEKIIQLALEKYPEIKAKLDFISQNRHLWKMNDDYNTVRIALNEFAEKGKTLNIINLTALVKFSAVRIRRVMAKFPILAELYNEIKSRQQTTKAQKAETIKQILLKAISHGEIIKEETIAEKLGLDVYETKKIIYRIPELANLMKSMQDEKTNDYSQLTRDILNLLLTAENCGETLTLNDIAAKLNVSFNAVTHIIYRSNPEIRKLFDKVKNKELLPKEAEDKHVMLAKEILKGVLPEGFESEDAINMPEDYIKFLSKFIANHTFEEDVLNLFKLRFAQYPGFATELLLNSNAKHSRLNSPRMMEMAFEMYEMNPDLTEKLLFETNDNGTFKYPINDVYQMIQESIITNQ